jgi:DNA-binding CsgD family transcriptional regulator
MASTFDEIELLKALFAAATGTSDPVAATDPDAPWLDFLTRLCAVTHADAAAVQLILKSGKTHHWHIGALNLPDPVTLQSMRSDRVYSQVDLPGVAKGTPPFRAVKCAMRTAGHVCVTLSHGQQDFRAIVGSQLSALTPYLGQAMTTWLRLRDERAQATQNQTMCDRLGLGTIVFNASKSIINLSPTARHLIETSPCFGTVSKGWLTLTEPDSTQAFNAAFMAATGNAEAKVPVKFASDPTLHLFLSQGIWQGEPVISGILRRAPSAGSLSVQTLADYFGLSRSEASLAALLCDGRSLKEAASDLGWTIETTRSCSKKIFARMDVTGQTGVLRAMLNSPIWL